MRSFRCQGATPCAADEVRFGRSGGGYESQASEGDDLAQATQSYKNHTRFYPPFHFFVMPVLLIHLVNEGRHVLNSPNRATAFALLPADLAARIGELRPSHLVALRFAGDRELPELVREVLAGTLTTQKAIKVRIKDWQGDYLRA